MNSSRISIINAKILYFSSLHFVCEEHIVDIAIGAYI